MSARRVHKTIRKRRKECRTDYKNRLNLLKSGKARIVFRKTNKQIIAQYVVSEEARDKIVLGITSASLLKYGWPENAKGGLKSLAASYLTGLLIGKQIISKKLETPIIDFGMIRTLHKTKPYAFLKGLIDANVKIKCPKESLPSEDRIKGEHLKNKIKFDEIKSKVEKV